MDITTNTKTHTTHQAWSARTASTVATIPQLDRQRIVQMLRDASTLSACHTGDEALAALKHWLAEVLAHAHVTPSDRAFYQTLESAVCQHPLFFQRLAAALQPAHGSRTLPPLSFRRLR